MSMFTHEYFHFFSTFKELGLLDFFITHALMLSIFLYILWPWSRCLLSACFSRRHTHLPPSCCFSGLLCVTLMISVISFLQAWRKHQCNPVFISDASGAETSSASCLLPLDSQSAAAIWVTLRVAWKCIIMCTWGCPSTHFYTYCVFLFFF